MNTDQISLAVILKNLGYIPAVLLGLSTQSYIILGVFMIVDTFTGVCRAGVVGGWRSVTSFKLTSGVISKLTVVLVPLLLVWTGKGLGLDITWFASSVLGMLILAQLYSIMGNIYAIRIRQDVHEFDAIAWVLNRVKYAIEKLLIDQNKGSKR